MDTSAFKFSPGEREQDEFLEVVFIFEHIVKVCGGFKEEAREMFRKGQRHDEEIVEIAPISNVDIIAAMKLSLEKKQKELEEEKEIKNLREQLASVEEEKATGSNCFCYDYDDYYDNYDCYHDVLQFSRRNPNQRS